MAYLIGTDIGTSSTKTTIFKDTGEILAQTAREYTYDIPATGYAEQDPDVWWEAAAETIRLAIRKAGIPPKEIKGVGLSGQMHGLVALDSAGRVVRKAILHCDVRAADTVDWITKRLSPDEYYDVTYNPAFSGFQLVSLLWMRLHEPALYEKVRRVLCPKDYVRYKMTGEIGMESTDASGTLAYDMKRQRWAEDILKKLDVSRAFFPEIIHSSYETAGAITRLAAEQTGLAPGTPVVYGGGDQAMHSLGNGVFEKNVMMVTIGTSGQVIVLSDNPVKNSAKNTNTFRYVEQGTWFGLGGILHAGITLNWFRKTFAPQFSYRQLDAMAETVPPCSNGLVFFPAMAGERTPYIDSDTRGVFLGMTMAHTQAYFARAVMEGVTMELKTGVEILKKLYGEPKKLICAGGGVKSELWCQIQADMFGREIHVSQIVEQACLGAAITAGVGAGYFTDIREGFLAMAEKKETVVEPILKNTEKYDAFYHEVFCNIYPKNQELFRSSGKY